MFEGSGIEYPTILDAQTLATSCCKNMFKSSALRYPVLTLQAQTLATSCYESMFEGCTSMNFNEYHNGRTTILENVSELSESCCAYMFKDCTSLTNIPHFNMFASLAPNCYCYMFSGCISLEPDLSTNIIYGETLSERCYCGMFEGCTSLEKTPKFEGNYLESGSFENTFANCTSLYEVYMLLNSYNSYDNSSMGYIFNGWLDGAGTNLTGFVFLNRSANFTFDDYSTITIPDGWDFKLIDVIDVIDVY
jgi:hypothetical protein